MADAGGRTIGAEELAAVSRVLQSGMLSAVWGTEVRALEREMAELHGVSHAVAASSGTAALHLAVAAVAPNPGDEIITSPISDFGTVAPILAQNAVPVFADVDPYTGNLDPAAVAAAIGPRTRAILAVHLFGAAAGSRLPVYGSTSANTGTAFCARMGATVPKSLIGDVMISSPGSGATAATARCRAAVPELAATACDTPWRSAISRSRARTSVPQTELSMPDSSTRLTAANSSAPIVRPLASAMLGNDTHPPGLQQYRA
jgi:hypothetical protein